MRFLRNKTLLIVALAAAAVYAGTMVSPPSLMDDVDAVQAQIARNMLTSGDWVTARLDGVAYLEKAPLIYWAMACSYKVFGAHDWAARIPMVLAAILLALITAAFGRWAFGDRAGLYAGLAMATCFGLWLFTRILIPDVMLTASVALSMWAFLRTIDEVETRPRLWAFILAANLGVSLLFKSLIGVVFPVGAGLIYLSITRQIFQGKIWRRLHPLSGTLVILAIAAPWHVLAAIRNPPVFDFTMRSVPGQYHGFLWFFFINEQLLRFLNLRYPRDYDTVPRAAFWLLHLVWLFPWSVYLPAVMKLNFRPVDRAGRTRLLAAALVGVVLVFFTFSTTQEYYSMPCYPALALLIGSAMAAEGAWIKRGNAVLFAVLLCAGVAAGGFWLAVRGVAAPGDISSALTQNPQAYKLSLGHIEDLTVKSFAYLRTPLLLAAIAFLIGAAGALTRRFVLTTVAMCVLFFQAARLAMVAFDPYLSSRPMAETLLRMPPGELIVNHHYYTFSSVFFYTNRSALLLNGRYNNLVYGSYAPGAPDVFIDDAQFREMWRSGARYYVVGEDSAAERLRKIVGADAVHEVTESGGKFLWTNHALGGTT
ncbi:MAG TPA: glycosyltransferase family 39 protein [Bryobacteraceae bacterium]|nr:glycosyltransferase family 39 protein [Bryobacteraceae bacterium]